MHILPRLSNIRSRPSLTTTPLHSSNISLKVNITMRMTTAQGVNTPTHPPAIPISPTTITTATIITIMPMLPGCAASTPIFTTAATTHHTTPICIGTTTTHGAGAPASIWVTTGGIPALDSPGAILHTGDIPTGIHTMDMVGDILTMDSVTEVTGAATTTATGMGTGMAFTMETDITTTVLTTIPIITDTGTQA